MKRIKYLYLIVESNDDEIDESNLRVKDVPYSSSNLEMASKEAYNGEYEIVEIPLSPAEEIIELKQNLSSTDYLCLKHADGVLSDEEYEPIRVQRQQWRDRINELEEV